MARRGVLLLIDTGVLGQITYLNNYPKAKLWLEFINKISFSILIPEICDYELRRELIRNDNKKSINKLNNLRKQDKILELNSINILEAAEIWAWARNNGKATTDDKSLDGDVLVIAQAISQFSFFEDVIIVTTNAKDFYKFKDKFPNLKIWDWKQALSDYIYEEINLYSDIIV